MCKKIFIPKDKLCYEFGPYDFDECENIKVDPEHPEILCYNNFLIQKENNALWKACGNEEIPTFVKSIMWGAYHGRQDIEELIIPDSVEFVDGGVFPYSSLKRIRLPKTQLEIGGAMFKGCVNLVAVDVPPNITCIGYQAFHGCTSLESLDLPDSITRIEWDAFAECMRLESVHMPKGLKEIQHDAFHNCENLKSIEIPEGVNAIGGGAFWGCCALESVKLPQGLERIDESTFFNCTQLRNVEIPDGVKEIHNGAFCGCTSLRSIYIPSSVTKIISIVFPNQGHNGYSLTIYGSKDSCAEEYANRHGYNFIAVEEKTTLSQQPDDCAKTDK